MQVITGRLKSLRSLIEEHDPTAVVLAASTPRAAAALGISRNTAKSHVASILGKLRAGSRREAATFGVRSGVMSL
jgi:hypothetical protein